MGKKKRNNKIVKPGLPPGTLIYTGHRSEHPSLVTTVAFSEHIYYEKEGFSLELHKKPGLVAWTDILWPWKMCLTLNNAQR
jgi:hypothetical protein